MSPNRWSLKLSDFLVALDSQNPWQRIGTVPTALGHRVERSLPALLEQTLREPGTRYQLILGPRRVGKTVGMYQTIRRLLAAEVPADQLWFLRMDHPLFINESLGSLIGALIDSQRATRDKPLYLFLDEVNYARDWRLWLKTFYDEQYPVRVVATSSSSAALHRGTAESGIGRWSEQYLAPYSFAEYLKLMDVARPARHAGHHLGDAIDDALVANADYTEMARWRTSFMLIGGFPELLLQNFDRDDAESSMLRSQQTLRSEAVQRVTGMDLPQVFGIRHPIVLERLLYILAGQMCGLFSPTKCASTLGITAQTVLQYVDHLEKAFLVFSLPSYSGSEVNVQRRGRKVYFVDGAVRNAALQRGLLPLTDSQEIGVLVENLVAAHLYALSLQSGTRLFHWRDGKNEVDLIYDDPNRPLAFEVSAAANHHLKGLNALRAKYPRFQNSCYIVSPMYSNAVLPARDSDGIGRIPLESLLLATSDAAHHATSVRYRGPGDASQKSGDKAS